VNTTELVVAGVTKADMTRPPTWFEWLTVAAIILGPVLALWVQRVLDRIRERRAAPRTCAGKWARTTSPRHQTGPASTQ
jgi:hypothetical protein